MSWYSLTVVQLALCILRVLPAKVNLFSLLAEMQYLQVMGKKNPLIEKPAKGF